jgi:peptidoglycan hydrolase-like protein with peptidoglycan-binding domain
MSVHARLPVTRQPDADQEAQPQQEVDGPFSNGWLNEALGAAFGADVGGFGASFGEVAANAEIGAEAHTTGADMSFGAGIDAGGGDLDSIEAIAHETSHALGGTDPNGSVLDTEGDRGEVAADAAGRRFREWAARGFEGPAPALDAVRGGAQTHRKDSGGSALTGSPMLRMGSKGSLVSLLQELLNAAGASLVVDGDFGRLTEAAVINYQVRMGLTVDGIVGPQTAGSLNSSGSSSGASSSGTSGSSAATTGAAVTGNPILRKGSTGSLVSSLQTLLNTFGAGLAVDGEFGSLTDGAVRSFQSANGLTVDGVVGPSTAGKLNDPSSKKIGSSSSGSSGGSFEGTEAYDDVRDAVLAAAETHLGAPYYWGADGPSMFDCSGFVLYVLRQDTGLVAWGDDTAAGIKNRLPATNAPQKGDPVFFSSGGKVEHVELCTGSGSGTIGAGGGGSSTFGDDPNAKVKWDDWTWDGRAKSFGSIQGLIDDYLAKNKD